MAYLSTFFFVHVKHGHMALEDSLIANTRCRSCVLDVLENVTVTHAPDHAMIQLRALVVGTCHVTDPEYSLYWTRSSRSGGGLPSHNFEKYFHPVWPSLRTCFIRVLSQSDTCTRVRVPPTPRQP